MNDSDGAPRLEDFTSVGTRVSWGAILAGAFLALGVFFLLATLGSAVGLSIGERTSPTALQTGAVAWAFLTTITAVFIGGLVTSVFTAGENKTEAAMSGIIMWAVLFALFLVLGGVGIRAGFHAMQAMDGAQTVSTRTWETGAREAGVPAEQIEDWRRKAGNGDQTAGDQRNQQEAAAAATRIGWYTFAGTWLSMLAAAAGALVGAGPTFRIVAVQRSLPRNGSVQAPASTAYSRT